MEGAVDEMKDAKKFFQNMDMIRRFISECMYEFAVKTNALELLQEIENSNSIFVDGNPEDWSVKDE